ncbi:DUF427 domain-containing protein [Psychroflexus montanilacus]|uniref:DUF427 domain-containing protein n=1 Tax=Psychroflexus montanilacus TaxID=2873598 RepID=UPI001CD00FAA|nr:DUF427 domain-containing protein [Psychroflexus montanilacus]MBZ9651991.1 DUF427 domain-containing protein [Psychroflexus montanilacus]
MKAVWNGATLAESEKTIIIEGNHYFPPNSITEAYFEKSDYSTSCPWKGKASYYTISVDGKKNKDAAWYYPDTKSAADEIKNYVAFWKGVEILE